MSLDITTAILWILSILGAVGVPTVLIESRPHPGTDTVEGYFDYHRELLVEKHTIPVELGRMPFLNRCLFRKIRLTSISKDRLGHRQAQLTVKSGSSSEVVADGKWSDDARERTFFLKRGGVPKSKNSFTAELEINIERSSSEIERNVEVHFFPRNLDGLLAIVITINNKLDLPVKTFEFTYPIPGLKKIKSVLVRKLNLVPETLDYVLADFGLRVESSATNPLGVDTSTTSVPILVGSVSLHPGITEITFEYAIS